MDCPECIPAYVTGLGDDEDNGPLVGPAGDVSTASFIHLLGFPGAEAEAENTRMFSQWGVNSWDDMACFVAVDVEKFIVASESVVLHPQRLRKQLSFLMEYARLGREDVHPVSDLCG